MDRGFLKDTSARQRMSARWALEVEIKKEEIKQKGGRFAQPWVCEETDPFTPRIRYFDFPKTRMPSHIKTYDGSEDPKDHLKIFQAATKTERWAMPTWYHMFNSTLTGNARYIKDPIELHNIKQRDGESMEDFVRRYKVESRKSNYLKNGKLVPLEYAMVSKLEEIPSAAKPIIEERVKVAINPKYPEQTPADMTGVPRHIVKHRLNAQEGCSRNAGETYQRLVDKAFHKQIGRNLEVYMDDLVIKSRTEDEIVRDIEETFKTLREINMKLNPKKCTFGVEEEMFLGYKVNAKGLKVCPDKVDAVQSLPSLKCLKDVQKLNGKLASLNRFWAKSAEKSLPLFKTLKKCMKKSDFHWTTKAKEAFKQMKQLIAELPMLTTPMEKEVLIIYLAASKETGIKRFGTKLYVNGKAGAGFST
nr:reverse transcriptase domain-containing protein [Tanacetum cinerariifolium]